MPHLVVRHVTAYRYTEPVSFGDGEQLIREGETSQEIFIVLAGALVVAGLALLWRAMCEFYIAVFRISDDLHALRQMEDKRN